MDNQGLLLTLALATFLIVIAYLAFSFFKTKKAADKGETSAMGARSAAQQERGESLMQQNDAEKAIDPTIKPRP